MVARDGDWPGWRKLCHVLDFLIYGQGVLFDIALLCQANFYPNVNLSCNNVDTVVHIYLVGEMYSF